MKSLIAVILCLVLVLSLAGCSLFGGFLNEISDYEDIYEDDIEYDYYDEDNDFESEYNESDIVVDDYNSSTTPSSEEAKPSKPAKTESSNSSKVEKITKNQALKIAKTLIQKFEQYYGFGCCCELEDAYGDMTAFLTPNQKENYFSNQYKIKCCQNAKEVQRHIDKCIDKSIKCNVDENALFYDNKGNLYIMVTPMGIVCFDNVKIVNYSDNKIIAKAEAYTEGETFANMIFTIKKMNGNFVVVNSKYE